MRDDSRGDLENERQSNNFNAGHACHGWHVEKRTQVAFRSREELCSELGEGQAATRCRQRPS